ncbi:ATP-binding protein [Streptomyces sp. NPDC002514]
MTVTCRYASGMSQQQIAARHPSTLGAAWPLPHCPEAASDARRITKQLLAEWGVADGAADSVLLTVSELVTNAVEHGLAPVTFGLSRDSSTRQVHIEVADGGPAVAGRDWGADGADGEHGRGLTIVDHLTAAHGDRREPGHATYWADVAA